MAKPGKKVSWHARPWWTAAGSVAGAAAVVVGLLAWLYPRSAEPASTPVPVPSAGGGVSVSVPTSDEPAATSGPNFQVALQVSEFHGWQSDVSTVPSVGLQVLAQYRNTGTVQQDNVVLKLQLPPELSYLSGSTRLGNGQHPSGIAISDAIKPEGINVGSYSPGANAWVIFSVVVGDETKFLCGTRTLAPELTVETNDGTKASEAIIRVRRNC